MTPSKNLQFSGKAKILISIFLLVVASCLFVYFHNPQPQQQLSLKTSEINKSQTSFPASEKSDTISTIHSSKRMVSEKPLQKPDKASARLNKRHKRLDRPIRSVSKENFPKTVPEAELLNSPDVENRVSALSKLEDIAADGDEEARELIYRSLEDNNGEVRARAAEALGWIEDREAVESLAELLRNDEDPEVRASAADALGEIGDKSAVRALKNAALNDKDEDVQDNAMDAIEALRE